MKLNTDTYLALSDDILNHLNGLVTQYQNDHSMNTSESLELVNKVIDEYCELIKEINSKKEAEYIELGNKSLEILKLGMHIKAVFERNRTYSRQPKLQQVA